MDPQSDFIQSFGTQFQIGRRVVNRIPPQDYEQFDLAAVDFTDQLLKLLDLRFV